MGMLPITEGDAKAEEEDETKTITLGKGLVWQPLGDGFNCETKDCGKPAYKYCDYILNTYGFSWKGCGRKMCMTHCAFKVQEYNESKGWDSELIYHHCRDAECEQTYKKCVRLILEYENIQDNRKLKCKLITIGVFVLIILIVIVEVLIS